MNKVDERKQLTMYESMFKAIRRIKKKADRCDAYDAVLSYGFYKTIPDLESLPDSAAIAFDLIRPIFDSARKKAENGKQGGSKPKANCKQTQREKEGEKEKEGEVEKENECYIESANADSSTEPKSKELKGPDKLPTRPRFTPPSVEEVRAYCQENNYTAVDPESFVDFYQSKGWKVGKDPMKDWKAAVRNWSRGRGSSGGNGGSYPQKNKPIWGGTGELGEAELEAIQRTLKEG